MKTIVYLRKKTTK